MFGIEPQTLGQEWLRALAILHGYPPLRWLEAAPVVLLLRADRVTRQHWQAGALGAAGETLPAGDAQQAWALELPEEWLLYRRLDLPRLPGDQVRDAVWLDIRSSSPFAEGDTVWGFTEERGAEKITVRAALASRRQVGEYLQSAQSAGWPVEQSEVWALADPHEPIVLQGYGEAARRQRAGKRRRLNSLLLAGLLALLAALAVTPTIQLRLKAIQANAAYERLNRQAQAGNAERDAFARAAQDIEVIKNAGAAGVNVLEVLKLLTETLPADVSLTSFKLENANQVEFTALADNAAAVVQLLGDVPAFTDVRSAGAVTRVGSGKDSFRAQLTLVPAHFQRLYHAAPAAGEAAGQAAALPGEGGS